jgi:curved DNA-binding protein CbpA
VIDHYAILGIAPDSEAETIKAAYRALVRIHHPDHNPQQTAEAHERFLEIKTAYDLLSDPEQRATYDAELVVAYADRYEFAYEEEPESQYAENPPARMPIAHGDGSNALLRLMLIVILPILAAVVAALTLDSVWGMGIATLAALLAAIWIGSLLGADED